ncbi:hypothetical protein CEXT_371811 [Caerostris extrusa]|uniref:Uncharacterized protein n=1 Tax=Caerostris extrusa TaxID=172846 RepID=A0AAV4Y6U4_CAEEX|nr:hypothetical protein CEXT_371811 [Caerostris extrusa]
MQNNVRISVTMRRRPIKTPFYTLLLTFYQSKMSFVPVVFGALKDGHRCREQTPPKSDLPDLPAEHGTARPLISLASLEPCILAEN